MRAHSGILFLLAVLAGTIPGSAASLEAGMQEPFVILHEPISDDLTLAPDELTGSRLNDLTYKRNRQVELQCGVEIAAIPAVNVEWRLTQAALSGDMEYDLVSVPAGTAKRLEEQGSLQILRDIDTLYLSPAFLDTSPCLYANGGYYGDTLQNLALSGEWTREAFLRISKEAQNEDVPVLVRDADFTHSGEQTLDTEGESLVSQFLDNIYDALNDILPFETRPRYLSGSSVAPHFIESTVGSSLTYDALGYRILPMPMEGDSYVTPVGEDCHLLAVPIGAGTAKSVEVASALAYHSAASMADSYYEYRSNSDAVSEAVMRLIHESRERID
ncbi:MAG: hypothetical protein IJ493_02790 [Clostridia bacterium]|nr:hypothetical protein [Clostridia bacterium]